MRELTLEVPDGRYAVIEFGTPGSGPDVLLLHEVASSAAVWVEVGQELSEFAHVVAVDLAGHGRTVVTDESARRMASDLPVVTRALGLSRPVIVAEHMESLAVCRDSLPEIEPRGVVVLAMASALRGDDARREWEETLGPESVDGWGDRLDMFATGTAADRDSYVEARLEKARKDWTLEAIEAHQLRRHYERVMRTTPDGWERVPTRPLYEEALAVVARGPFGLDALDLVPVPMWLVLQEGNLTDDDISRLEDYCAGRDDRELRLIPGSGTVETTDPVVIAEAVATLARTWSASGPADPSVGERTSRDHPHYPVG